jgi:hypothetical protein
MEQIIIEGLLSFGYRPYPGTNERVYAKPVGYNLYRFDLDTLVWVNQWQNARTGKPILVEGETAKLDLLDLRPSEDRNQDSGELLKTYTPVMQMQGFLRLYEYHASGRHESGEDFGFITN